MLLASVPAPSTVLVMLSSSSGSFQAPQEFPEPAARDSRQHLVGVCAVDDSVQTTSSNATLCAQGTLCAQTPSPL